MTRHASTAPRHLRQPEGVESAVLLNGRHGGLGWGTSPLPLFAACWPRLKPPNPQSGRTSTRCAAPSRAESLAAASSANAPANARIEQFGGMRHGLKFARQRPPGDPTPSSLRCR